MGAAYASDVPPWLYGASCTRASLGIMAPGDSQPCVTPWCPGAKELGLGVNFGALRMPEEVSMRNRDFNPKSAQTPGKYRSGCKAHARALSNSVQQLSGEQISFT